MTAINWSNVTDAAQIPAQANIASNNTFWVAVLFLVWIVLLVMFLRFGFEVALLVSAFIGLILALILVYSGLVAWYFLLFFAGLILLMFLYITYSSNRRT